MLQRGLFKKKLCKQEKEKNDLVGCFKEKKTYFIQKYKLKVKQKKTRL
jgi:hypothetical protein